MAEPLGRTQSGSTPVKTRVRLDIPEYSPEALPEHNAREINLLLLEAGPKRIAHFLANTAEWANAKYGYLDQHGRYRLALSLREYLDGKPALKARMEQLGLSYQALPARPVRNRRTCTASPSTTPSSQATHPCKRAMPLPSPARALPWKNADTLNRFLLSATAEDVHRFTSNPGDWAFTRYACCDDRGRERTYDSLAQYLHAQPELRVRLQQLGIDCAAVPAVKPPTQPTRRTRSTANMGKTPAAEPAAGPTPPRTVEGATPPSSGGATVPDPVLTIPHHIATDAPTQAGASGRQTLADASPPSITQKPTLDDEVDRHAASPSDISGGSDRPPISLPGGSAGTVASTTPLSLEGGAGNNVARLLPEPAPVQDNNEPLPCRFEVDSAPLFRPETEVLAAVIDPSAAPPILTHLRDPLAEWDTAELDDMKKVFHDFSDKHIQMPLHLLNTPGAQSYALDISDEELAAIQRQLRSAGPHSGQALTFTLFTAHGKEWYAGIVIQRDPPRAPWWTRLLTNLVRRQSPEPATPTDTRSFAFYLFGKTNLADVHDIKLHIALSTTFQIPIDRVEIHPAPLDIPAQRISSMPGAELNLNAQPSTPNVDEGALPQGESPITIHTSGETEAPSPNPVSISNSCLLTVHMVREFDANREHYKNSRPQEVVQAISQRWRKLRMEDCRQVWTQLQEMMSSARKMP